MGTLTVRLPDDKHDRLKSLAAHRQVSVNKLMEELSTQALAEFDSEVRFRALASVGKPKRGLDLLQSWIGISMVSRDILRQLTLAIPDSSRRR